MLRHIVLQQNIRVGRSGSRRAILDFNAQREYYDRVALPLAQSLSHG